MTYTCRMGMPHEDLQTMRKIRRKLEEASKLAEDLSNSEWSDVILSTALDRANVDIRALERTVEPRGDQ